MIRRKGVDPLLGDLAQLDVAGNPLIEELQQAGAATAARNSVLPLHQEYLTTGLHGPDA